MVEDWTVVSIISLSTGTTEYTECQAYFPVVRTRSPPPFRMGVLLVLPFGSKGETHSLVVEVVVGGGGGNSDDWTHRKNVSDILVPSRDVANLFYSAGNLLLYIVIPLR
jgi:hypothetical protein